MSRGNSARSASALCLIDSLIVINTITCSIYSRCLPGEFFFLSAEVFTRHLVDVIRSCAESIIIVEVAKDLTDLILSANTRIRESACRHFNNSAICLSNASSVKLLQNATFSQFDILVKGEFFNIVNLLIQCITQIEFADDICLNLHLLAKRRRHS